MNDLNETRRCEDGRIAQRVQLHPSSPDGHHWLCMTWPDGLLTATLLTDEDVADWAALWPAGEHR